MAPYEDETSSTASFEEVGPSSKNGPNTTKVVDMTKKGETPDVLYVLQYLGLGNKVVESRKSAEPFVDIPEQGELETTLDPADRPILEIVTRVSTTVRYRGGRRAPRRAPPMRAPVGYDNYTYQYEDDNYDDLSYSDSEDENRITRVERTKMIIHSDHLVQALRAVIGYYPYVNLGGKETSIDAPYRVLVHHRRELAHFKFNQPIHHDLEYAQITAKHIDVLLDFLDKTMGDQIREEEARHQRALPMATFDNFWLLLKPGEVVYTKKHDVWTPYVVSSLSQSPSVDSSRRSSLQVNCWFLEFVGNKVTRFMAAFHVSPWTGEQSIASLPVVPAAFYPDADAMAAKQVRLGKQYWDLLQKPTYMEYDGLLVTRGPAQMLSRGPSGYMTGRVICDAEGYGRYFGQSPEWNSRAGRHFPPPPNNGPPAPTKDHLPHYLPRCRCEACLEHELEEQTSQFMGFEDVDPRKVDSPPVGDLFYMALTNVMPAFILGDRRWGHVNIEHLRPVKTDGEAFKYLVLDDEVKSTLKALIAKFAVGGSSSAGASPGWEGRVTPWGNDFVKNKGEGCIFLLHGTPGVGKTCSAECAAEMSGRPLISLTSGDLSVNAHSVETNLSYFLQLGQRWGALVLLDEADVYLERRRAKDISRNGLVSVFLRALEYYRGVLFLTTNRVRAFDAAFTSRIHVALHYKDLTDADRERIWANNFERLDRDSKGKVRVAVAAREYVYEATEVRGLKWNGREIRNALQTAVALAESDAADAGHDVVNVTDRHVRRVVKMSRGFKDYMRSAQLYGDGSDSDDDAPAGEEEEEVPESDFSD